MQKNKENKIQELINRLCPEGVEFYEMGELGKFYGGLTGKTKDDFKDGNAKFITYKNIYSNLSVNINVDDKVTVNEGENQRTLEFGDILFTGSSERLDECGFSSVLTTKTDEKIYLNSFCFIYRFNDTSIMNPEFSKYLFRSTKLRNQIIKTANGVTRYNVSKKLMQKVRIPVPPIEVQNEIVNVLDNFTFSSSELKTGLNEELKSRKKQYQYYVDKLFDLDENIKVSLSEICNIERGGNFAKKHFTEIGIPAIHYGKIYTYYGLYTDSTLNYIDEEIAKKQKFANNNDIIMAITSENIKDVCKCVLWEGKKPVAVGGHTAILRHNQNARFLAYYFTSTHFQIQKESYCVGTKVIEMRPSNLEKILIPIPSLEEQKRIVDILDRLYMLTNDLSIGLPAEIEARQKQYEYYRDKLLNFKEMKKN